MNLIKIPSLNSNVVVSTSEIIRIEAVRNYSRVYFTDGTKMVALKVLQWFEKSLPASMFVRVNRSHLINMQFVKTIKGIDTKTLLMDSGDYIVVSRRKKDRLQYLIERSLECNSNYPNLALVLYTTQFFPFKPLI